MCACPLLSLVNPRRATGVRTDNRVAEEEAPDWRHRRYTVQYYTRRVYMIPLLLVGHELSLLAMGQDLLRIATCSLCRLMRNFAFAAVKATVIITSVTHGIGKGTSSALARRSPLGVRTCAGARRPPEGVLSSENGWPAARLRTMPITRIKPSV